MTAEARMASSVNASRAISDIPQPAKFYRSPLAGATTVCSGSQHIARPRLVEALSKLLIPGHSPGLLELPHPTFHMQALFLPSPSFVW